jgi:Domain of unknown function (DUF6249)
MEVDIIVTIALAVFAIFTIAQISRIIRTKALHQTLRQSIEKGQPLTPEIFDGMERAPDSRSIDERIGFVLVAIGLALLAAGAIAKAGDFRGAAAVAMFPLFVGGALLLRLRLATRGKADS